MKITVKDVDYAAELARLALTADEKVKYTEQLDKILGHMDELNKVDTANVEPVFQAVALKNVFREDAAKISGLADGIIANAPDREDRFFKVKKVIE